jgi:hypothetical protein
LCAATISINDEVAVKSPSIPLFKGGMLSEGVKPLLEKRGREDLFSKFLGHNTVCEINRAVAGNTTAVA